MSTKTYFELPKVVKLLDTCTFKRYCKFIEYISWMQQGKSIFQIIFNQVQISVVKGPVSLIDFQPHLSRGYLLIMFRLPKQYFLET